MVLWSIRMVRLTISNPVSVLLRRNVSRRSPAKMSSCRSRRLRYTMKALEISYSPSTGPSAIITLLTRCRVREAGFSDQPTSDVTRSEEHTSELQSLMRTSYAVFCLKKKKRKNKIQQEHTRRH